jgi:hypothetical protein
MRTFKEYLSLKNKSMKHSVYDRARNLVKSYLDMRHGGQEIEGEMLQLIIGEVAKILSSAATTGQDAMAAVENYLGKVFK